MVNPFYVYCPCAFLDDLAQTGPITGRYHGFGMRPTKSRTTILTIGHSTRSIESFIEMLRSHGVKRLVDVRTIPRSRTNPQFNRDSLMQSLAEAGIEYTHAAALGGLRHARKDSLNAGWRNASFRGYADYMQTPEFKAAITTLIEAARREQITIMCAEAVPWRCHRSLIGDALNVRGIAVEDIMSATRTQPHELTSFAKVEGTQVTYPAAD
jgi:uncharacterized protein (DUF488 family)